MIIAVNARLLLPEKLEGMGRFAHETLKIIVRKHPEHRFVFIFDRKYAQDFLYADNVTPVVGFPPARHPLLWYMFFDRSIPGILNKYKADLFFSPDGWLSLRTPVKSLPVIHDLNFFQFPQFIPWHIRKYYHYFFPRFISKAHRIATVSEFTRLDIMNRFDYQGNRIDVVYNGVSEGFKPVSPGAQEEVRKEFAHGCPFFLFVGLIHPRKNLTNLISAFNRFKDSSASNVKLLVVGSQKWWTQEMQQALDSCRFRDDVLFMGRVPDPILHRITASALAMVYVSYFEGFGIPVLEAMNCDTPVIASAATSLPEIAGDAVYYVNPYNVHSIQSAMQEIYTSRDLRNQLIHKARIQRRKFSWERSAELLWNSIEKCLGD